MIRTHYKMIVFIILTLFLQFCCSSRNSTPQEQKGDLPKKALSPAVQKLSPGTAQIRAIPLSYQQEEQNIVCSLRIVKVTGYGMSTPMLSVGSEMKMKMEKSPSDQQISIFDSARQQAKPVLVTVKHVAGGMGEMKGPDWKIISIESISDDNLKEE